MHAGPVHSLDVHHGVASPLVSPFQFILWSVVPVKLQCVRVSAQSVVVQDVDEEAAVNCTRAPHVKRF